MSKIPEDMIKLIHLTCSNTRVFEILEELTKLRHLTISKGSDTEIPEEIEDSIKIFRE